MQVSWMILKQEFKTAVREIAADVMEMGDVEPEGVTRLPQSRGNTLVDEQLLFMDEQESGFWRCSLLPVKML